MFAFSVDQSRQILQDMGLKPIPRDIPDKSDSTQLLESVPKMTPEQISEFIKRAGEINGNH